MCVLSSANQSLKCTVTKCLQGVAIKELVFNCEVIVSETFITVSCYYCESSNIQS